MRQIVYSNGNSGNGEQRDYNPEVEFEYLDADVWIETDVEGSKDIAYTQEVLEALGEDDEESDSN